MILEDKTLFRQLNESNFDLAIVDLIANECRLRLRKKLDNECNLRESLKNATRYPMDEGGGHIWSVLDQNESRKQVLGL